MKRIFSSCIAVSIGLATPIMAQDCAPVDTISAGKLTVAVYDYPPLNIVEADGTITGIDPQITAQVAKDACLELVQIVMDPAATIQAVVTGKADMAIGGWNRTLKRAEVVGISAPTYLDPMGIVSKEGLSDPKALAGKTVGTITGFQWVEDLQAIYGDKVRLYPNAVSLAQDLSLGRIDVAFDAYNSAVYAQAQTGAYAGVKIELTALDDRIKATTAPAQSSLLYTKGNESLGKAINDSLANQHADGRIEQLMLDYGFDARVADVGEPRLN